jgi:hypothetical protein
MKYKQHLRILFWNCVYRNNCRRTMLGSMVLQMWVMNVVTTVGHHSLTFLRFLNDAVTRQDLIFYFDLLQTLIYEYKQQA